MQVTPPAIEVRDGVADQLAGAVVGGLTAAVDFKDGVGQDGAGVQAGVVAGAADGVNAGVFQQKQFILTGGVCVVGADQLFLQA